VIPEAYIIDWKRNAPWRTDVQVEQDLILSRILVELYNDPLISDNLHFRGGTALYKLFLKPTARYSEDIDLVQEEAVAIGNIMDAVRRICNPLLGKPKTKQKQNSVIFTYRQKSEIPPSVEMRIKIEINTREHFSVFGIIKKSFQVRSEWFNGEALINTYTLEELLSTKLRALYQRNKGRDLFDLCYGLSSEKVDTKKIIDSFKIYMDNQNLTVSKKEFRNNLDLKLQYSDFKDDITALVRPDIPYSIKNAFHIVDDKLISRL
jgi:predicted nucleotidyltransferase component of viral defense system